MRPPASVSGTRCTRCTPGLELQASEDVRTTDQSVRLFEPAEAGFGEVEDFEPPIPLCGVFLVHAKELGGKKRCLFAAGSGPNFEDCVALIVGIPRQQRQFYLVFERRKAFPQRAQFLLRELLQLGILARRRYLRQREPLVLSAAQLVDARNDGTEVAVFL